MSVGLCPDPMHEGELTAFPQTKPLAGLGGPSDSKTCAGTGKRRGGHRDEKGVGGKEGDGREVKGRFGGRDEMGAQNGVNDKSAVDARVFTTV